LVAAIVLEEPNKRWCSTPDAAMARRLLTAPPNASAHRTEVNAASDEGRFPMRVLAVSIAAALVAVGCGRTVPLSPDPPEVATIDSSASTSAVRPEGCPVMDVILKAEPAKQRLTYRVQATYVMDHYGSRCQPPTWRVNERTGRIYPTFDPYVVYVQSTRPDAYVTIVATAPNGRSVWE
jgi:hypothetical protein